MEMATKQDFGKWLGDTAGRGNRSRVSEIDELNHRQPETWKGKDDPEFRKIIAAVRQSWMKWQDGEKPKRNAVGKDFDARKTLEELKLIKPKAKIERRF